jgi:FkbM family methyltransferase
MTDSFEICFRAESADARFAMKTIGGFDHIVALVKKYGLAAYEEPFPAFLAAVLRRRQGLFIDVGANTGLYALLAASLSERAIVHAFEPVIAIADALEQNIHLNPGFATRLILHRIALSQFEGEALIHETENTLGFIATTSSLSAEFSRTQNVNRSYLVPTSTLDSFVNENEIEDIALIKIDVEGHEKQVLLGAESTVLSRRPLLAVEMLGNAEFDFFDQFLQENGYIDGVLRPGSLRFASRTEYVSDGWNHVLIPEEQADFAAHCAETIGLRIFR